MTTGDKTKKFEFAITLTDADGNPLEGEFDYTGPGETDAGKISSGGTVELADGEKVIITGLPEGTEYKVTETVPEGYMDPAVDGNVGTIANGQTSEAAFVNNEIIEHPGELRIAKFVETGDENKKFAFTLTLTDASGKALADEFDYTGPGESDSGKIKSGDTVSLAHEETVVITGLPEGTKYTIVETVPDGYEQPKTTNASGTIGATEAAQATFINIEPEPEPSDESQIEKYVSEDVHKDVAADELFPYDILVYVPTDADTVQIRDVLDERLAFASTAEAIAATAVVKDANDHTVGGTVAKTDGTPIEATAKIEDRTLTVEIADATAARGSYVQVTFGARLGDYKDPVTVTDNGDVLGGAASHTGVPNTAEYRIGIRNGSEVDYSKYAPGDTPGDNPDGWNESNTVTVKPKDAPEPEPSDESQIEKYVNKDVHADLGSLDETFTYDIMAFIPADADSFVITDTLVGPIDFAGDASAVKVYDMGTDNNHNPGGTVATAGTEITANLDVAIDDATKTLTVSMDNVNGRTQRNRASTIIHCLI